MLQPSIFIQAWRLDGEDKLINLMDPKLSSTYVEKEVQRVLQVALLCTQAVSTTRPSMTRVVAMLLGDIEIPRATSGPGFMAGLTGSDTSTTAATTTTTTTTTTADTSFSSNHNHLRRGRSESSPLIGSKSSDHNHLRRGRSQSSPLIGSKSSDHNHLRRGRSESSPLIDSKGTGEFSETRLPRDVCSEMVLR